MSWMWIVIPIVFFMFMRRGWGHHRSMKRQFQRSMGTMREDLHRSLDPAEPSPQLQEEVQDHRRYIDQLENRVAELENRLDFTERLLAGRREAAKEA